MSRVLLTGASSQIGYFLLPALLAAGHDVQAIIRHQAPRWFAGPDFQIDTHLNWISTNDLSELQPASVLISLGPMALALELLQQTAGIERVIVISSSSIDTKLQGDDAQERQVLREMQELEKSLQRKCETKGISCLILRPTLIYGCGLDQNLTFIANVLRRFGYFPVSRNAHGKRHPVHAQDLANLIVQQLATRQTGTYRLGGQSILSYQQMVEAVQKALGVGLVLRLPAGLLRTGLKLAHLTGRVTAFNTAMIDRQTQDMLFDQQAAINDLSWQPRPFELSVEMLTPPE